MFLSLVPESSVCWRRFALALVCVFVAAAATPLAQAPLRKIGEMQLTVVGLSATLESTNPVVPKNTPAGVRVVVRGGGGEVSAADLTRLFGEDVHLEGDYTGPGLSGALSLSTASTADRLLLKLPAVQTSGDYRLSNIRLVANSRPVLDVTPQQVPVQVIDQILITSVTTRPLTLSEIKSKGIVLDGDDYLGFEFVIGVKLESRPVQLSFPAIFTSNGDFLPEFTFPLPQLPSPQLEMPSLPYFMPTMLVVEAPDAARLIPGFDDTKLPDVRIPSLLVIPGNVGYLKQFFSAQLFVGNGAPGGSRLTVRDLKGTIRLPAGDDREAGTDDDPLTLATLEGGPAPATQRVAAPGPDGVAGTGDDVGTLEPGEQAQAEFLIRGEQEGFHDLHFDIEGVLDGLATGPANIRGVTKGAVLVRNPYFDMTFTVPSVVRRGERFKLFATVTNKSESAPANDLTVSFDSTRMSGMRLDGDPTRRIETLRAGDSQTLQFDFISERTGQVVASYLRFFTDTGSNGEMRFTAGVGERGIALSPDTLVLPAPVDALPSDVVEAAMRVLGQAWSISLATDDTRPRGVLPISRLLAKNKGLALAEAGLRVSLGQPVADALRDLALDFYGAEETSINAGQIDPGFDQLLRETDAGHSFRRALGAALGPFVQQAGGALTYQRDWTDVLASGSDRITIATTDGPVDLAIIDGSGGRTESHAAPSALPKSEATSAVIFPLSTTADGSMLGLIAQPAHGPYAIEVTGHGAGTIDLAVSLPGADGITRRGVVTVPLSSGSRARLTIDLARPDSLVLERDPGADGEAGIEQPIVLESVAPAGARLMSVSVVGPETIASAGSYGKHALVLLDRIVDADSAADVTRIRIAKNSVTRAKRVLSGRFVMLELEHPEGPYVPVTVAYAGMTDLRGVTGPSAEVSLTSRLVDPGAVVTGRVFSAEGLPVGGLEVFYSNSSGSRGSCEFAANGLERYQSKVLTAADGSFEFRYVWKDVFCGVPFRLTAQDPGSSSVRRLHRQVLTAGEQIVLDLGLFGRGTITGTVRDLNGQPVGGAHVLVTSDTDSVLQHVALTDGAGRYTIPEVLVGAISVVARKAYDNGATIRQGLAAGRLARSATSVPIDVVIDSGSASVSGVVMQVTPDGPKPVPGALVVYDIARGQFDYQPAAGQLSGADGAFSFPSVPAGAFRVSATVPTTLRERGTTSGLAAIGDVIEGVNVVVEARGTATVRGRVRRADNTITRSMVREGDHATWTDPTGAFELTGVAIDPDTPHGLTAETPDGRKGVANVIVAAPGVIDNVVITLSALGSAQFTVLDPKGAPVAGQEVVILADQFGLRGACALGCGCSIRTGKTDNGGRVTFNGLPAGPVLARAIRSDATFMDVANGRTTIVGEGHVAQGVMRFEGFGTVSGLVLDPDLRPAVGADVTVLSRRFENDSCSMRNGLLSHAVRTDAFGRFSLSSVGVGEVRISASQAFLPTPVAATLAITRPEEEKQITLKLVDTFAGELSGRILQPDGVTPAGPGAEVTINGPLPDITVRTDDQGRFRFAKILPAGLWTLTAVDPYSGAMERETVSLKAGQDLARQVRLKGRGTVRVSVVDALDHPVIGAVVRLQETSFPNRVLEGIADDASGGVVTFERVFEGPFAVDASDPTGAGRAWGSVPAPDAHIDVVVRYGITGTVRGRFLLPNGTAIPYGIVKLLAAGREIGQATTAGSGEAGSFEFKYVPAGPVRLEATDPASARTGVAAGSVVDPLEPLILDVHAEGLGTVTGLVLAGAVPQQAADVELVSGRFRVSAATDGEGRYTVEGVPEGQVTVRASIAAGVQTGTATGALTGDGSVLTLDVPVRDAGRVTGTVRPANGTVLQPTIVTAAASGTMLTFSTPIDEYGHFEFPRLPAGRVRFTANVIGSIDQARLEREIPGSETTDIELQLFGVGALRGQALDSSGAPTSGSVTVSSEGNQGFSSITITVGDDGRYRFPALLAGPVSIQLRFTGGATTLYGNDATTVAAGEEAVLDVRLQDTATVTGIVKRPNGTTPALGADAVIRLASNVAVPVQVIDEGRFTARGLPLGNFTVQITDPFTGGLALITGSATVNGQTIDLGTVVLDDSPVSVEDIDPDDGSTDVALAQPVVLELTDSLANTSGIEVRNGTTALSTVRVLSDNGRTLTLTSAAPGNVWPDDANLSVIVTATATDIYGRHPAQEFTSHFHTVDRSPPHVTATTPVNTAVNVGSQTTVDVTFHEPLAAATNFATLVTVAGVSGTTVQIALATVRFTPAAPLADNSIYLVVVNGAVDAAGNAQTQPYAFSFTTIDTVAPTLTLSSPGAWTNNARPFIDVRLSDAVSGIESATGRLLLDATALPINPSVFALQMTAPSPLAEGSHTVDASAADRSGNAATLQAVFGVDLTPPSVPAIAGVSEGDVVRGTITIGATASDALSGVARIEILRNGLWFVSLTAPSFEKSIATVLLQEGPRTLTAVAYDAAGNASPASPAIHIIVDNEPLLVSFSSPASNTATRATITTRATTNEAVERIEFTLGATTLVDTTSPYEVTFDTAAVDEGTQVITARAVDQFGLTATATRSIVVDRTGPGAPDVNVISAEPPAAGASLVVAQSGAIEPLVSVSIVNTANGASATTTAAANGSFTASVTASVDDLLSIRGTDALGNVGAASIVAVRRTPSMPPEEAAATLRFDGLLADRVSSGTGGAALVPDGTNDALFTFALEPDTSITRRLMSIRVDNEDDGTARSTDPGTGGIVGVALDAQGSFINGTDGRVSRDITGNATFTLVVHNGGFIRDGATYRATAAFTDGAKFVGRFRIVPATDRTQVAHSARIVPDWPTVTVTPGTPGTTLLTISDIRDIEGTRVPDGTRIALSVANLASKDPRGGSIVSAGGVIQGGEPAANHTDFRVFTVVGGTAIATYTTGTLSPAAITGLHVVVQMLAADEQNNVLGEKVVATADMSVRLASDRATVYVTPGSLYADYADRRASVTAYVRKTDGTPAADGTRIFLRVSTSNGTILGGGATTSEYKPFTVSAGRVIGEYSALNVGAFLPSNTIVPIEVYGANASNLVDTSLKLGTADIVLTPGAGAEFHINPASLPYVFPERTAQVVVQHVHDLRGNLVPDGARFLLTAENSRVKYLGSTPSTYGGRFLDGEVSTLYGADFRLFNLDLSRIVATYTPNSASGGGVGAGQEKTTRVAVGPARPSGEILDRTTMDAIALGKIAILGPTNAVGSAVPNSLLSDRALRTAVVTFSPVLDAFGNPLPEGSNVLASATATVQARDASGNLVSLTSPGGGQIVNGIPGTGNIGAYKVLTVQNGEVSVIYGTPTSALGVGATSTANVSLLEYPKPGSFADTVALGVVPIQLTGMTSASGTVSPSTVFADGGDRRVMVTFSNFRDAAGQPAPDGAKVVAKIISGSGSIVNSNVSPCCGLGGRVFTIANGQIVVEYSAQNVFGAGTVVIHALSADANGTTLSNTPLASVSIQLVAPTAGGVVTVSPPNLLADDGNRQAFVTVTDLRDTNGSPLPDGAKVVLRLSTIDGDPTLGTLGSAGAAPGDGTPLPSQANHWSFTVVSGEVRAIYTGTGVYATVNQTRSRTIQALAGRADGSLLNNTVLTSGVVSLHGTTFATGNGPASMSGNSSLTVTFNGIKDKAGNLLPDGAKVVAHLQFCYQWGGCSGTGYPGGGFDGGVPFGDYDKRIFTVIDGAIEVPFHVGATTNTFYSALIRLYPTRLNGSVISFTPLVGGSLTIPITP